MKDFCEMDHLVDVCVLIRFRLISSSSTNTPPNWTIHSSDIQTWVSFSLSHLNLLFALGKSNIWHIWMLPREHLLWPWSCVCICLSPVRISVWFCFVSFCVSHPPLFSPVLPLLSPHHARHAPAAPTLRTLQLAARSLPAQGQPHIPTLNPSANRPTISGVTGTNEITRACTRLKQKLAKMLFFIKWHAVT